MDSKINIEMGLRIQAHNIKNMKLKSFEDRASVYNFGKTAKMVGGFDNLSKETKDYIGKVQKEFERYQKELGK